MPSFTRLSLDGLTFKLPFFVILTLVSAVGSTDIGFVGVSEVTIASTASTSWGLSGAASLELSLDQKDQPEDFVVPTIFCEAGGTSSGRSEKSLGAIFTS
jgi:hypothetical protein